MSKSPGGINQNTQQPVKDESKKSESVKSKSNSEINTHKMRDETKKQLQLWRDAEKKAPWHDAPPKVKVQIQRDFEIWGLSIVDIEFTIGLPPQEAYNILVNPDNKSFSRIIKNRELLKNISRKITPSNDKSWQNVKVEKALSWNFLWLSKTIPIDLSINEDPKELSLRYEKNYKGKTLKCMEFFFGVIRVEPMYIDSKRLCKNIEPKSQEEYEKCSSGQGRVATKVKMGMFFKPSSFYNLPPISWYIRWFTLKTTKILIEDLQAWGAKIRRS